MDFIVEASEAISRVISNKSDAKPNKSKNINRNAPISTESNIASNTEWFVNSKNTKTVTESDSFADSSDNDITETTVELETRNKQHESVEKVINSGCTEITETVCSKKIKTDYMFSNNVFSFLKNIMVKCTLNKIALRAGKTIIYEVMTDTASVIKELQHQIIELVF